MGKTTISWTDYTFNPWIGCQKQSAGCANCYAERDFKRKPRWANCWGDPRITERKRTSESNWKQPLKWDRQAAADGVRSKVFCASLADFFEVAPGLDEIRADTWRLIAETPHLDWLLLTKRVENIELHCPSVWPRNAWLGFTAENQEMLDRRAPVALRMKTLHDIPVLFVSVEPMLSDIDLDGYVGRAVQLSDYDFDYGDGVDWVIVGGESGPYARPLHPGWVHSLRDQCVEYGTPFMLKQWGEWAELGSEINGSVDTTNIASKTFDDGTVVFRIGKHTAGRLLDGREWNEFPE